MGRWKRIVYAVGMLAVLALTIGWIGIRNRSIPGQAVSLQTPGPSTAAVIPVTVAVASDVSGVSAVAIDVDLNHDHEFKGAGELSYACGVSTDGESRVVRLHGLIHGDYKVRARLTLANGDELCSPVQSLKVLPPPANFLPVSFEVNKGQTDSAVLFLGRCRNQIVRITANETHIATPVPRQANPGSERTEKDSGYCSLQTDHFRLVGANAASVPTGQKKLPGVSNYFIGNKPENWRTDIENYREVISREVYPGIDMVYHSNQGRLEYDFRVAPGKDPAPICVEFSAATGLTIDADGALVIKRANVELRHAAPVTYQKRNGQLCAVKSAWVLKGPRQAGFVLDGYDAREELVIDPLLFSTYHGGTGSEGTSGSVAVDSAGNTYVHSGTSSVDFPVVSPLDGTIGGTDDLSITKISAAGVVVYATFVGGSSGDALAGTSGRNVAVDGAGNVYFTGRTDSADFPLVSPAQPAMGSSQDACVVKLNAAGNAILFSTFLGGGASDGGTAIAVDAANAIYVGGTTNGMFPTTPGAMQTTFGGGSNDGFIAKITPAGTIAYATYLGGNDRDDVRVIAVNAGNAYVVGDTWSSSLATTVGAFQTTFGGNYDGFLVKLNTTGAAADYFTYIGGTNAEEARGVAVDATGNAYVCGSTWTTGFPTTTPGVVEPTSASPGFNGYVLKFNPAGSSLLFATFVGGAGKGIPWAMDIDSTGNIYLGGYSNLGVPLVNNFQGTAGGIDGYVAALNPTASAYLLSSPLGGTGNETVFGVAGDGAGNFWAVGRTTSTDFPTQSPIQAANGGGTQDLFITKISTAAPTAGVTITQSGGSTDVAEGGATDTYTVVLNLAPTADVTITLNPGPQVTATPATLTFTTANWNVAQTVTVTAVDDALVEGGHTGTITHTAVSADAAYNAVAIANVTANITDNDGAPPVPPPPPSGGGGISEGSYAGSKGNGNSSEGTFGFGRQTGRSQHPILSGPWQNAGILRVRNVSHQYPPDTQMNAEPASGLGLRAWSIALALALALGLSLVFGVFLGGKKIGLLGAK